MDEHGEDLSELVEQLVEHPRDSREEKVLVSHPKQTAVKILVLECSVQKIIYIYIYISANCLIMIIYVKKDNKNWILFIEI